jgi:hypothetical protein
MISRKPLLTAEPSKFLLTGSIIALFIGFSPYLFYLYEIFPSSNVWENSFFTYESRYYENVLTAAWTYLSKLIPFLLLLIWFFTCKHWWYHVILVPAIMYLYQMVSAFYEDAYLDVIDLDSGDLIYLAPFFIIILSIVYLIRIKVFDRIYGIDLSEIERENISPFSPFSDKEYKEIKDFREGTGNNNDIQEEYYIKL